MKEKYQYVSNIAALKCKIEEAEANCLELVSSGKKQFIRPAVYQSKCLKTAVDNYDLKFCSIVVFVMLLCPFIVLHSSRSWFWCK